MTEDETLQARPTGVGDTVPKASKVSDASPKQMLVAWGNDQDGWVRDAVGQAIASNQPLSEVQIEALYGRYLSEKKFNSDPIDDVPILQLIDEAAGVEDVLELTCLADVEGVNALAPKQSIEFDPSLTVLFGQNGSGKTGYSRILKRLAAVRTAETILPNAHAPGRESKPQATVRFTLNGDPQSIVWRDETGVAPFTRMSVFDAPAVNLHVDDELNYVFTPGELALFSHVSHAVRQVQERLEAGARELRPAGNPFIIHFKRGTSVYPAIESVGPATDIGELRLLADASTEGEARLQVLEDEVAALRGGNVEARFGLAKQEAERLSIFVRMGRAVAAFDRGSYAETLMSVRQLEDEHRRVRGELFSPTELPGEPDDEWTTFIGAAERYRQHLDKHDYPADGDKCLYCGQELSSAATALVMKYRTLLDDALARQVDTARKRFADAKLRLGELNMDVLKEHTRQLNEVDPRPAYVEAVASLIGSLDAVASASDAELALPESDARPAALALIEKLEARRLLVEATLKDLEEQKRDRVEALANRERELNELAARRSLARHLPAIEIFVDNARRSSKMDALAKSMSGGLLRSLTQLSKLASEDLVNKNFERLFDEECRVLRAPSVALEFQGRRGRAERKKAVATYRPSAVLSEGEQKVLAIADFLAESRMTGVKAPIVFDDPVTSLDYLRLNEVATRVSALAETHQVIVFTHNIFFASTLLALRDNKRQRCKFYEVKDVDAEKGIVMPDVEPRQDNPTEIGKKINILIQRVGSADPTIQEALVESGYGHLRSWCEAFVEQELLQNVSQRFRINVLMGGLKRIKIDRFEVAVDQLLPIFDRCSRFMPGHSQPIEQLNVRASVADLSRDWEAAKEIRLAYIAKS